MEIKKSTKGSMKGKQTLYFLIGLNLALAAVWLLFGMQYMPSEAEKSKIVVDIPDDSGIIVDILEPPKPEIEIKPEEIPLPEPEIELHEIEEVEQPIEETTEYKPIDEFAPTNTFFGDKKHDININVKDLQEKAQKLQDGRELKPLNPHEVDKMAVYPGCEKFQTKKELVKCFGDELSKDILSYLDKEFPNVDQDRVAVQLQFNINTNGEIVDIVPVGDKSFQLQAMQALEKVNDRMLRKGKKIIPARMTDNTNAIMKFKNNVVLERP